MPEYITIDNVTVNFESGLNVLEHAKKAGIYIPSFCYAPELSVYGACRMCLVEVTDAEAGRTFLYASCSLLAKPGMVIKSNTEKIIKYRKNILKLLLTRHSQDCNVCSADLTCKLRAFAGKYGIRAVHNERRFVKKVIDESSPSIIRDTSKCVSCGLCIRMCGEVQKTGAIDFTRRASDTIIAFDGGCSISDSFCTACGQCVHVCSTGSLSVKSSIDSVRKLLTDKNKKISVQVSPAVRIAVGEFFGVSPKENTFGRLAVALRKIGFDEVHDTSIASDVAVIQEAERLLLRLQSRRDMPIFSSFCPAWVRFLEKHYPELMIYVSTVKSSMQIFAGTYKREARKDYIRGAVMPCTAKKREILHKKSKGDTAFVLSSSEIISMIRDACIDYIALSGDDSDECKWGRASGAGMLFDVTGGFTEAVLRCMFSVFGRNTQENYQYIAESGIRGLPKPDPKSGTLSNGIKTVVFNLGEVEFSVAVVSGLANADTLIKRIKNGEHFDFVEVTACPGGCICGGGQPKAEWFVKEKRKDALYLADSICQVKSAEQNPDIRLWFDLMNSKSLEHKYWHRPLCGF